MHLEAFTRSLISEFSVVVEILRCQFRRFGDLGVARFGDVARWVIKYVIRAHHSNATTTLTLHPQQKNIIIATHLPPPFPPILA
jgi:hypothetical protein